MCEEHCATITGIVSGTLSLSQRQPLSVGDAHLLPLPWRPHLTLRLRFECSGTLYGRSHTVCVLWWRPVSLSMMSPRSVRGGLFTVPPLGLDDTPLHGGTRVRHPSVGGGLAQCWGGVWATSLTLKQLKELEKRSQACGHSRGSCRTPPLETGLEDTGCEVTYLPCGSLPDTASGTDRNVLLHSEAVFLIANPQAAFFLDGEVSPPRAASGLSWALEARPACLCLAQS